MTEASDMDREDDMAAAEYALRLLAPEEQAAFARRLASEPSLRAAVAAWEERFAALADEVEPVAPPQQLRDRVSAELFGGAERPAGLLQRLAFWRGLSFAGFAAAAALAALLFLDGAERAATPAYVAEIEAPDDSLRLVAVYDADAGTLRLNRVAGASAEGRALELWLVAGTDAPVSLGVLPDDPRAAVEVPEALRSRVPGAVLAISDEAPGGAPNPPEHGPVLATGQVETI